MLKLFLALTVLHSLTQPPSGGCVLKHFPSALIIQLVTAAFGRLCVETLADAYTKTVAAQPPSGGCVLKQIPKPPTKPKFRPAAFGRLCVETKPVTKQKQNDVQPPSGGCVLKQNMGLRLIDG